MGRYVDRCIRGRVFGESQQNARYQTLPAAASFAPERPDHGNRVLRMTSYVKPGEPGTGARACPSTGTRRSRWRCSTRRRVEIRAAEAAASGGGLGGSVAYCLS